MGWWCTQCNCEHENTACPRQFESVSSPMQDTGTAFPEPAIDERIDELEANNKALQDVANAQLEEIAELEKQLDDAKKNWVLRSRSLHENLDRAKAKVKGLEAACAYTVNALADDPGPTVRACLVLKLKALLLPADQGSAGHTEGGKG